MSLIRENGQLVPATQTLIHTVAAGKTGKFLEVTVTNTDAVTQQGLKIWFVPSGQSVGDQYLEYNFVTGTDSRLRPAQTWISRKNPFLEPGTEIHAQAENAGKVMLALALEEVAQ